MTHLSSTYHLTWLLLGGAFVVSAPSCGGRAGENSASGGAASTMGSSSDEDGDGVLDSLGKTVDRDKDGKPDRIDVDGDGQGDGVAIDTDGDGKPDGVGLDTDGDGIIDAIDTDGDGKPDDVGSTSGDGDTGSGGDAGDGDSGSGGDATSTGDGDDDTGSGGNAGDGDGDASGGTGGDDGPNPGVQTLGETCGSPGGLACAGERQKLQLLCDGSGKWVQNGTCAGTAVCDTGEKNRGSCQETIPACATSDQFCDGDDLRECRVDGLAGELVGCDGVCSDGATPNGDCCPGSDVDLLDCSGSCAAAPSGCQIYSNSKCSYLSEISVSISPTVVRTPAAEEFCPTPFDDGCQEAFFTIYLDDPTQTYHIDLPPGTMASAGPRFEDTQTSISPCAFRDSSPLAEGCVTVEALTEEEAAIASIVGTGALIAVPFGTGTRNITISLGACP